MKQLTPNIPAQTGGLLAKAILNLFEAGGIEIRDIPDWLHALADEIDRAEKALFGKEKS